MRNLKDKSVDGIVWNLSEKVGVQLIKLILGVILARLLTPSDYGLIGMITVLFAIAMVFIDSGFSTAYIQKKEVNNSDASTIFYFNLILSILSYVVFYYAAPFFSSFYNESQLTSLIRVMSVVLIINSLGIVQLAKLTRDVDFKKKTILNLTSTILSSICGIAAALMDYGVWSLVIQGVIAASIRSLGLWWFYSWRPKWVFNVEALKSMMSFSLWSLFSGLITKIFNNIYVLVIGKYFPAYELGFYSKAKQFQMIISKQFANSAGAVAFPVFAKLQDDKDILKASAKRFLQTLMFYIAPMSALFYVIAEPLFMILLTDKWSPMVPYFKLLLIAGIFYPMHMINVQLLIGQGEVKLNFKLAVIKNLLRVTNIIFMYQFGVIFIIYGEIAVSIIGLAINTYYSKKFLNYGLFEQFRDLSSPFIISVFLAVIGSILSSTISNDYLEVLLLIVFVASMYIIAMYIFNKKLLEYNFELIKNKF